MKESTKNKFILILLSVAAGFLLGGEIIDFRISEIDSLTLEERVLVERNKLDGYISSLDSFVSTWAYSDSLDLNPLSRLPVEIIAIHHEADCSFAARRYALLGKMKKKYEFSFEERRKKNERIEWVRNSVSGALILLQTGYTLYRMLAYEDETGPAYLGVAALLDLCVLLIHLQTSEIIYTE
ncbi:MAG: hypothetical protein AB7T10_02465 [bacterium]